MDVTTDARVEGAKNADDEEEEEDVCPICLDPPLHPVELECSHKFCFTCAKGLSNTDDPLNPGCCSLCRAPIPPGFFSRPQLLQRTHSDLEGPQRRLVEVRASSQRGDRGCVLRRRAQLR